MDQIPTNTLCPFCGCLMHKGGIVQCPLVIKVEYYPNGSVKSVEKKP